MKITIAVAFANYSQEIFIRKFSKFPNELRVSYKSISSNLGPGLKN